MDLQEKLIELSEYGVSFNVANGNFVIRIKYDKHWTIIQPDGDDIAFYCDESSDSVYYYVASVTTNIEKLFHAIDETIEYNRELEKKVELFKKKMNELQEIFAQEPLETLNTLEFKIKKKKEKQKKEKPLKETDTIQNNELPDEEKTEEINKTEDISDIDAKISELLNK